MLLARHVEPVSEDGLLNIAGGGLNVYHADTNRLALAIKIDVPWDQTNIVHRWKLELLDSDGQLVTHPDGETPIALEQDFEVGRPAGLKPGSPVSMPMSFTFDGLSLERPGSYVWQLSIDGRNETDWHVSFSAPAAQAPYESYSGLE